MVKQAVEDRAGGRDIAEQFAPFFDGSIRGHHGGTVFITAHDDFQKDLAAFLRQDFESRIVNDKQIGFEVFVEQAAFSDLGFLAKQFAHQIEDGAVKNQEAGSQALRDRWPARDDFCRSCRERHDRHYAGNRTMPGDVTFSFER
jgi:hypothetical protein